MSLRRERALDREQRTRAAVGWWGFGQLVVLTSAYADARGWGPAPALLAATVFGFCVSLAAAISATVSVSRAWSGRPSKAAFRCAALWFASGGCAVAWLAIWIVR